MSTPREFPRSMQQFLLFILFLISNSRHSQQPSKHGWKTSINKVGKLRTPQLSFPAALLSSHCLVQLIVAGLELSPS